MSVLLLRLAGPMQAWGADSRFARRETLRHPTKSGVLGLLAAADGRRRTDPIEDLMHLEFGVRVDQPGRVLRDFHTAHNWRTGASMPLSERFYLCDAVFVAAVAGESGLIEALDAAIRNPRFPLFLGRRSCPVTGRLALGVVEGGGVEDALRAVPWQASPWYRREQEREVVLRLFLDVPAGTAGSETVRDVPVSFDPRQRQHSWRSVASSYVVAENPDGRGIDYFAAVEGA